MKTTGSPNGAATTAPQDTSTSPVHLHVVADAGNAQPVTSINATGRGSKQAAVVIGAAAIRDVATGLVTLRVQVCIETGQGQGCTLHRDYGCDPTSDNDRSALRALMRATGVRVDHLGNFAPDALVGLKMIVQPTLGGGWMGECAPPDPDDELRGTLACTEKGKVRATGANVEKILRGCSAVRGCLRYDVLAQQIEVTDGLFAGVAQDLHVAVANWLSEKWDLHASSAVVGEQLLYVARRYGSFDPLREYLEGLRWDGVPRISKWLTTYCRAKGTRYVQRVGMKWLVAAVARALVPGAKVDTILVLRGKQGAKKSTAFYVLGGAWFSDTPLVIGDKDSRITAARTWIIELAELASLRRAEIEAMKAFVSARRDRVRPPYARADETFERRCVFGGSTNEDEFLADATGNRRYWIVSVGDVDVEALQRDRDQLWAEAVVRYREGARWWFEGDEQSEADRVTEQHEIEMPWVDKIRDFVNASAKGTTFRLADIAEAALSIPIEDIDRHKLAVAKALRKAGLVRRQVGSDRERRWVPK